MNTFWKQLGRTLLESRGKDRGVPRFTFPDNEIVLSGGVLQISSLWNGAYLNLHPTHYAVAIAPDGRLINLKGGYNELPAGRYVLHYVDKQNRASIIPRVLQTTLDGLQISLEVLITYRVADPIKVFEIESPVETLRVFIQSYLKEFVRSHKYDEIVGSSDEHAADDSLVVRYIKDQHTGRNILSKLFYLADIVVSFSEEK